MELRVLVEEHKRLAEVEKMLYLQAANRLNSNMKEWLAPQNFGRELVKSCIRDLSGEVVRNYFDLSDYALTVDQMARRLLTFQYDKEYDPLGSNEEYQKDVYQFKDYASSTLRAIQERNEKWTAPVFPGERSGNEPFYGRDGKRYSSRTKFKRDAINPASNSMQDDLTQREAAKDSIAGDHIRAVKSAEYNARYLGEDYVDTMDKVYNSEANMQWIDSRANSSKGAAATNKETIQRWENTTGATRQHLIDLGYLNEDGKVSKHVRKEMEKNFKSIGNQESLQTLKRAKYGTIGKDALKESGKALNKLLAGQIIYYALPPILHEAQVILEERGMTMPVFLERLQQAMKRIGKYVMSKLKVIFASVATGLLKKFVKTFFDTLLSILKETVKKAVSLVKNLALAVIDAVKILGDKNATRAEKADGVFHLVSVTLTSFAIEVIFEYAHQQLGLPEFLIGPLQLVTTVLASNTVMLILEKADLFDVRYGLLVANLERMFTETAQSYLDELQQAKALTVEKTNELLGQAEQELADIRERLWNRKMDEESVEEDLEQFNRMFQMGINFRQEWDRYTSFTASEPQSQEDVAREEERSVVTYRRAT